jgi:Phosphoribosylaminoimidazole carboxylase (NCAIR synthetase)
MTHPLPLARLGIVGGGQLARMLAPACHAYQVELNILDPLDQSPAAQAANGQIVGSLHDADALSALCAVSDVVTFDLENVGADMLVTLANQGVRMVPDPATVQLIQNK